MIENDKNNKKLWAYIKSKKQENCGVADLKDENKVIQDPKAKAELLNNQFSSVFSNPIPRINREIGRENDYPKMNPIKVTKNGVLKLLLNINEHKATGPDKIPGKILKLCASELTEVLVLLFQASLDQGMVPNDWKNANIVPLFKKGDKSKPENYRPVSLTSITCKLLEHIIHSNVMDHLDKFEILNDIQHGFRQKRSCETQLITTINDFSKSLNHKGQTDAILLDFSKAFDKVDHHGLLIKLKHYGIQDSLLKWSQSFLMGRAQKVIVDGKESNSKPVLSGVPQGTVLGPLFFLIYINDINRNLSKGTKMRLFADDSLLYREIKDSHDCKILQRDLETLQMWEKEWKMQFHPDKCQVIRITNKKKPTEVEYQLHNQTLAETKNAKYLGIIIDDKLQWKDQCRTMCKKTNSLLAFLKRNIYGCPEHVKDKCYKAFIRPVLEYGSCVWDPHCQNQIDEIEKVQKNAARFVTNNYSFKTGNTKINMKKLRWIPLEEQRARNKVTFLFKAINGHSKIPTDELNMVSSSRTRYGTQAFKLPHSNVNSHLYSFFPNTIRLWNNLPTPVKNSNSVEEFKTQLSDITLRVKY